jgi:hypothetical protein
LWWSFPDQDRLLSHCDGSLPQDLMNRLVPEAEYWAMRLEALLSTLR